MTKVLVIGASRGIGLETVRAAVHAGHSVRALARSAESITIPDAGLESGDALALVALPSITQWNSLGLQAII
jgi:NAD(P)-dependent dehydrogenase (short-subunit alcohol dehydrogenase family)